MEKSREEYLKLIEYRQIKENDLPKELLSDEEFVRQAYKIDKFIVHFADTEISASIFREEIETKPYIFDQFPKRVLLMCEEEYIKALKKGIGDKDLNVKNCPKEILISNPDLCDYLLEEGVSPDVFPEEILSRYPSDYIEDLKTKAQANKKMEKIQPIRVPRQVKNRDTQDRGVNKGATTKEVKIYPKEVLLRSPELAKISLKRGVPLENIPEKCQLMFPELCIEHLKDGDYESNFKHLADEIKVKHVDVCVAAKKDLNKVRKNGYIQKNTAIYGYIPNELYSDISFIKSVSEFDDEIFDYIPREKYSDAEFVQEIFKVNKRVARYVDSQMLKKLMNQDETKIGAEWQEECLSEIKDKQNVILASPTGSGKTRVFLEWAKQKQERPIYITAPIKALSNQRWRELKEQGFIVGIETGDVKNVPNNCEFVCCTQEIYTNKYLEQEDVTLIMDEFHFIFEDSDRARTYIDGLQCAKAKNILLCSGTFGDVNELSGYINEVSRREFYAYENHTRLTELSFGGHIDKGEIRNALVVAFTPENCKSICNSIKASRTEKDEEDIKQIVGIAQKYGVDENELMECVKYGVAYYHGKMLPKEKLFLEELFEKKLIDSLSGTDALAMGVNFPIENVVFAQLAKNIFGPITKNLFDQLAGRAGRKGFFDKGFVYYCDNFIDSRGKILEANGYNTAELYYELLFSESERSSVRLKPKIKDILLGNTTIEKEAQFIVTYSEGVNYSLKITQDRIAKKIEYIQNYDLINAVIDEEQSCDKKEESSKELEYRKRELMPLQEEFRKNIAIVYFKEFNEEVNCEVFKDILLGTHIDTMIKKYSSSFRELLQLRKYIQRLPSKYRKNIDIVELENRINSIDSTVLNFERGALSTDEIASGVREESLETDELKEAVNTMASQLGVSEKREQNYSNSQMGE